MRIVAAGIGSFVKPDVTVPDITPLCAVVNLGANTRINEAKVMLQTGLSKIKDNTGK